MSILSLAIQQKKKKKTGEDGSSPVSTNKPRTILASAIEAKKSGIGLSTPVVNPVALKSYNAHKAKVLSGDDSWKRPNDVSAFDYSGTDLALDSTTDYNRLADLKLAAEREAENNKYAIAALGSGGRSTTAQDAYAAYLAEHTMHPTLQPVHTSEDSLVYQMLKDRAEAEKRQQSLPIAQRVQRLDPAKMRTVSDFASAFKSMTGTPAQDAFNDFRRKYTDYNSYLHAADFEEYSKKGAEIQNPTFEEAQGGANIFGWRPGAAEVGNIVTFSRDNLDKIRERMASDDRSQFVGNALYGYMTEEQVKIYNYILAKEGKEAAQIYLDSIAETLNEEYGKKVAADVESTRGTVFHPLMVAGTATSAGLDQYIGGVKQALNEYELPTSGIQYAGQAVREDQGAVGKFVYDAISTLSNMAPSILASYVAMGLGVPAKAAEWVAAGSIGLGSGGNAYKQALAEGRSKDEAKNVAFLTGASEAVLSKLLSGISAVGGLAPEKLLPKVAAIENGIWRVASAAGVKIGGEVSEEVLQLYLEPLFKTLIYGDEYDAPKVEEVAYTALLTMVTTGLLEGGEIAKYRTKEGAAAAMQAELQGDTQSESAGVSESPDAPGQVQSENAPAASQTEQTKASTGLRDPMTVIMEENRKAKAQQNEKNAAETQRNVSESDTEMDSEGMHRQIEEAFASGKMTEAEYDAAMDALMEQESLEGVNTLDTYNPEVLKNAEVRNDGRSSISDDGSQWSAGQSAGEQAGELAEGTGRDQSRQVQSQRAASRRDDVSRYYESRGQGAVSAREFLGTSKVNKVSTVQEMPENMVSQDRELAVIAQEARSMGLTPRFFVGEAYLQNGNTVDGMIRDNVVYIRTDNDKWTAVQNWEHEKAHGILRQSPGIGAQLYGRIVGKGEAARRKLHQTMQRYREAYHGIYDVDENGNEIWDDTVQEMILQEILADAYAGKDPYTQDVQQYTDVARDAVSQIESRGGEVRGPPEGVLSAADTSVKPAGNYDGINLSKDGDIFSYDFLTSLQDMTITMLPEVTAVCDGQNNVVPHKAVELGIENARSVGTERAGKVYVKNKYTGHELRVDVSSIRHSLNGDRNRKLTNARLGAVIGNLVQNAVPINALHNTAENVDGTYAMAAYAVDSKNREFVSIITVEQRSGTVAGIQSYDVTHSVSGRAKRTGSQADTKSQGVYPIKAANISIADLLENVNETYQSVLSNDVLAHFGADRSPNGYYSDRVKFSQSVDEVDTAATQDPIETMPAKAKRIMANAEWSLNNKLGKVFGIPYENRQKALAGIAREISKEFLETGTVSDETIDRTFEKAYRTIESDVDKKHGVDAEDYRKWAERDYIAEVAKHLAEMRLVKRYAAEKTEAKAKGESEKALTLEDLPKAYSELKAARRTADKAVARNLLTEEDELKVNALLRGDIDLDMLQPDRDNVRGITEVFNAKMEYEKVARQIRRWNATRKGELRTLADKLLETASDWKDKKSGWQYSRETMERNIRDIVPDKKVAQEIIDTLFKPVHDGAAAANRMKNEYRDRVRKLNLSREVVKGNTISEAAAVQLLGEAEDNIRYLQNSKFVKQRDGKTLDEWQGVVADLWEQNPKLNAAKIRNAVAEFRQIYDELFEQLNTVRMRNGYEPINYRKGYFPHFQNEGGDSILAQFGKSLGINTAALQLPTTINGLTYTFKPGKQWFSHELERKGNDTVYDAVEGFDTYIEGVADVINQTDNIQRLRAFATEIRMRTADEALKKRVRETETNPTINEEQKRALIEQIWKEGRYELGNLAVEMDEYTNLLAGKKSKRDRRMEESLNRKWYAIMKAFEGRMAANMVAINPGSWLTNFIPLTQGAATLDTGSLLSGMWDALRLGRAGRDEFAASSSFLTNRRGSDPLVQTWTQKTSAFLSSPMELIDSFTADTLVLARYNENRRRGLSEEAAMAEADSWAAGVMADRSKGATPTLFSATNPVTKLFTQFQLEANNQLSFVFKDLPREEKEKGIAALVLALFRFMLGAYLYNEIYEYIIGRRPALDPLGIINDTVGDITGYELPNLIEWGMNATKGEKTSFQVEKKDPYEAVATLSTTTLEELPFIGGLLGGGRLPVSSVLPDWEKLGKAIFSDGWDSKKKWATLGKEIVKPVTYLALPFGGGQVKKIIEGGQAVKEGGSYTIDSKGERILQYPVYNDSPGQAGINAARAMLFGKSSLPTAQNWVESGFNSLTSKQTGLYESLVKNGAAGEQAYQLILDIERAEGKENKLRVVADSALGENLKELTLTKQMTFPQYKKYMAARAVNVSTSDYISFLNLLNQEADEALFKSREGKPTTSEIETEMWSSDLPADVLRQFWDGNYMLSPQYEEMLKQFESETEIGSGSITATILKKVLNRTSFTRMQKRAIWKSYGWKSDPPW